MMVKMEHLGIAVDTQRMDMILLPKQSLIMTAKRVERSTVLVSTT